MISQALNGNQSVALKNTELTATECLPGQLSLRFNLAQAERVTFDMIRDVVRKQIDLYVDEPEFVELFDFCISLGAKDNSYFPNFLEFAARFINSKKRMLRLNGFTEINKMPDNCPKSKTAVLERAYRKKPSYVFCPTPEPAWGKTKHAEVIPLEQLLHYFHEESKTAVAAFETQEARLMFLANVDIAASDSFLAASAAKKREAMLNATSKYYRELEAVAKKKSVSVPPSKHPWIIFPNCGPQDARKTKNTDSNH